MQDVNFTWPQGEDLTIELRYKEGASSRTAQPVNLAAGYSASMSLANPASPGTALATLTSADGDIVLLSGVNEPNIRIYLDRSRTLTGGPFSSGGAYAYDLFLRNTTSDVQVKIMEGTINVKRSITQWA